VSIECGACRQPVAADDTFCEACGEALSPGAPPGGAASAPAAASEPLAGAGGIDITVPTRRPCGACGGDVVDDYCNTCGAKAPSERDHWCEQPAPWVAGVCDRGISHARNEDAMALAAAPDERFAVVVVCDGVTTAPDSDKASLAAARAACSSLVAAPRSGGSAAAVVSGHAAALQAAAAEAHSAAVAVARTLGNPAEPPSCTFIAALDQGELVSVAWCGDSRAYWMPDDGPALQLMTDHSLGAEAMKAGKPRAEAEAGAEFHTITRWLGADSVDPSAEIVSHTLPGCGWLLLCSDGLWNYASEAGALHDVLRAAAAAAGGDPAGLADRLVGWANEQGGQDNITAAVVRHGEWPPTTIPEGG
jgi:serine/threonine protein phosphatase PrpC